jgi:hypothetical protein
MRKPLLPIEGKHVVGGAVQILRGEVRPEVGAVPVDGPELHELVLLEDLLAGEDVIPREEGLSARRHHSAGKRRLLRVSERGEYAEARKAEQEGEHGSLSSSLRDDHVGSGHDVS